MELNPRAATGTDGSEQQARANMRVFVADLRARGVTVEACARCPEMDYGDGHWAFAVRVRGAVVLEIQMPGAPLERVRDGWRRLYLNGSARFWPLAVRTAQQAAYG
jgi:hypothetical protein